MDLIVNIVKSEYNRRRMMRLELQGRRLKGRPNWRFMDVVKRGH